MASPKDDADADLHAVSAKTSSFLQGSGLMRIPIPSQDFRQARRRRTRCGKRRAPPEIGLLDAQLTRLGLEHRLLHVLRILHFCTACMHAFATRIHAFTARARAAR
eukprot:6174307-Pleurochrysis_carterae.AAC.1